MRYEAYAREGYIERNSTGIFTDPDDERPNAWLIGVFIDGALAGSIRIFVASRAEHFLPISVGFPDVVAPRLEAGTIIVDGSRMTSRIEFTRAYPFMPHLLIRCAFVAADYFGADYMTAACREEYVSAYRRMWFAKVWAEPRPYPPLTRLQALVAHDCKALHEITRKRYPFVRSSEEERRALYSRSSNACEDPFEMLTAGRRRLMPMQSSTTCAA
jgi:hypothetical protein